MQDNFVPVVDAPEITASAAPNRLLLPDIAYIFVQLDTHV